ncbi:MAG: thiamine phosphate synthase [Novosphingobium aromaticivorans]|nr:thiamine phosphate synthase [Novosphingobium aromaticivorans]
MAKRHPVPRLLLISDARNDAFLARALARLPRGARGQGGASGLVFRHYHLDPPARARRFAALRKLARAHGVMLIAAGPPCGRGAQGRYGAPGTLARVPGPQSGLRLATAHNGREIGQAVRARADAVLLSPVFPTRSHPGGRVLGGLRFALLAARCPLPVLALGGMDAARARRLVAPHGPAHGWAAIDGLCV